jgi:hypothetical protein
MTRWITATVHGRRSADRMAEHALREQRLAGIRDAVEEFMYRLGLLIAGHDASRDMADDVVITQLQRELRPFLDAGDVMRPDFGSFGDLRIEGELLRPSEQALATLEFDDRCTRVTAQGRVVATRGRRLRITMHVAVDPVQITACALCEIGDRRV